MFNVIDTNSIGARIRLLREKNGVSQEKLAFELHLTQNAISKIENGNTKNPKLEHLVEIAKYFNVSCDYLCCGKDSNSILELLEKYIVLEYDNLSITEATTYSYPKLRINKPFFDYLVKSANAKKNNLLPDNVKDFWLNQEKENFNKSIKSNIPTEYEEFVPVPQELIYPDDNKKEWKQEDLIRTINNKWDNKY
ncbi:MAG: helix-turn-helix domain-containing protein [Acetobacter sp.]|nr:helix-turn-helix domain-containing protein [Bacteroides sp.]MCM1340905.1 helix-turn-helix domain-containing protein [Acetobacter sp.]MCM1432539.1 helix-turn-helix domain-containing protein [Clostridiales bacterium]